MKYDILHPSQCTTQQYSTVGLTLLHVYPSSMGTFVTLAEVLEVRGSPLEEDEVWCLLLATTDALLSISKKGNSFQVCFLAAGCVKEIMRWS